MKNYFKYILVLIFAFLPIHVEAVSWISGKPYLLNALTVLLAMTFFVLYTKTEKKKYLIYFILGAILAFTAEMVRSTSLIILIILYWVSFDNQLKKRIKTKFWNTFGIF
jgi:chromate transport protein ChrA